VTTRLVTYTTTRLQSSSSSVSTVCEAARFVVAASATDVLAVYPSRVESRTERVTTQMESSVQLGVVERLIKYLSGVVSGGIL